MVTKAELEQKFATAPEYKHGFVSDIEEDILPKGLNEDTVRYISEKKGEPDWLLEWRLRAYRHWLTMKEPKWANIHYGPIDYQEIHYYAAPKKRPASYDEVDPEIRAMYEKLGVPLQERAALAGVAVDALLARQGIYACINTQEASDETMRDGHVVRHKKRYWVVFHENTRSHAVKRRDGYFLVPIRRIVRQKYSGVVYNFETAGEPHTYLVKGFAVHNCTAPMRDENQLHAAVVELIALDDGEVKYSTIQNWYPGDKDGKGGIYNFVTKRGKALGRNSKISWTQVETGSAITWKYPSCILMGDNSIGEFYSVAIVNNYQQADTGTKMTHIGKNTKSTIISKGISAGLGQNTYRGRVQIHKGAVNSRNYSQCDSLLIGDRCGAHTFPDIEVNEPTAQLEHEATTSKIGDDQLFYCQQRGITPEDATNMIVNGFCKKVFLNLPMEFAVEAQKLIQVSLNLEGTVG